MNSIVFFTPLTEIQLQKVNEAAPGWKVIHGRDRSDWLPYLKKAVIIGGWNKDAEEQCLTGDSNLRWVHNWGAGVDGMPLEQLKERGIILTNSSGVHAYPISETIFALMLAFTRQIHTYIKNQSQKKWHHANLNAEMHGKTIGIVGVGRIGTETARLAKAFGMEVLGVRRTDESTAFVDRTYGYAQLNDCLSQCDYVVNTLPLTNETFHMIGKPQFESMKPSAIYINIGRGKTTDTEALMAALQNGGIAGAGLDVFETEPLPEDHPLWQMENVIVTPHSSGSTQYYNDRVIDIFVPNLREFVMGQRPAMNRVDFDKQY